MDTLRELMSLGRENWPFLKDVLSIVGGAAMILSYLSILTGIKRRRAERKEQRLSERELLRLTKQNEDHDRSEWFAYLYRHRREQWTADKVQDMTVQQACGYLGDDLPRWAKDGWERVLVSDLNKPIKKV